MRQAWLVGLFVCAACGDNTMPIEDDGQPAQLQLSLSLPTVKAGGTVTASVVAVDDFGAPTPLPLLTWSTSREDLATIDSKGTITTHASGFVAIQVASKAVSASIGLQIADDPAARCRLPGPQFGVGLGFPRIANRLKSTGDVRVKVLFVDFSDAAATRTPASVMSLLSPGAEQFYDTVSGGRMRLQLDPLLSWLRMSKPTTGYPWDPLTFEGQKSYIQEAVDLAGDQIDEEVDSVVVIANPDVTAFAYGPTLTANPGDGFLVGTKQIDSAATSGNDLLYWGSGWFNHEFGHAMGLADLYELGVSNPETFHYTGDFSMMGNIQGTAPEYLGWERWLLGWLDDTDVYCAPRGHATITLSPVESDGGVRLAVIPTGPTKAIVVEGRRALGYDKQLAAEGLLVYSLDTSIDTGAGVIKVLPVDDTDFHKTAALLDIGGSLTDSGVTVTHVSRNAASDRVDIKY